MRFVKKYFFIALLAGHSDLAYREEVYGRILFLAIILYIFLRLWQATYTACGAETLGNLTLPQMLWYLTVTEAIMLSAPRVTQQVDNDVRTGSITVQLILPQSYPLAILSNNFGKRAVRFMLNLFVGSCVAFALVGPLDSPLGLPYLLAAVPLAFVVDFLGCFLIGLAAFWLEDTSGIFLIYSRLSMILGGMLLPLELFPEWSKPIVKALPFQNIVYGPAHLFLKPEPGSLLAVLSGQCVSIVFLGLVIALVWRLVLRRVFANGG